MRTEQPSLDAGTGADTREREASHPTETTTAEDWIPGGTTQPPGPRNQCTNCGSHVTRGYRYQYADDGGYVHSCPRCGEARDRERVARGLGGDD